MVLTLLVLLVLFELFVLFVLFAITVPGTGAAAGMLSYVSRTESGTTTSEAIA